MGAGGAARAAPAASRDWEVHKFGGTCMATAERIRGACDLLLRAGDGGVGVGAVVSAIGNCDDFPVKVTDVLLTSIGLAERKDPAYAEELQKVVGRYTEVARELLEGAEGGEAELAAFLAGMEEDSASLGSMLGAVSLVGCAAGTMEDFIVGHGEIWNSRPVAAARRRVLAFAGALSPSLALWHCALRCLCRT